MADVTAERRELAICVREASKSYGNLAVLRGLDMDVPSGIMYVLITQTSLWASLSQRRKSGRVVFHTPDVFLDGKPQTPQYTKVAGLCQLFSGGGGQWDLLEKPYTPHTT